MFMCLLDGTKTQIRLGYKFDSPREKMGVFFLKYDFYEVIHF